MKRHKIFIIIASIITLLYVSLIIYIIKVPSCLTILYIYSQVWFNKDWKGVTLELKDKQMTASQPKDGVRLEGFGYSIKLQGYKNAKLQSNRNDFSLNYELPDMKAIMLQNDAEQGLAVDSFVSNFKKNNGKWKLIEAAAGRPMNSDYNLRYDLLCLSLSDFNIFDNNKNYGVADALSVKAGLTEPLTAIYQFDNGKIEGLGNVFKSGIAVDFINKTNPNKLFAVSFIGAWTQQEVDDAISTITFND